MKEKIIAGIYGGAIGDALGVPVEFTNREVLDKNPVTDMREYGTYQQPKGTWSDDSSLTFCLMEGLCNGYDLEDIASKFADWKYHSYWTPHGSVFDIGMATRKAIYEIQKGTKPVLCGGMDEWSNGNGSLMRILPMAFYLYNEADINVRFEKVKAVSSITHAHARSVIACFIYVEYAIKLIEGFDKLEAFQITQKTVTKYLVDYEMNTAEVNLFHRVLKGNIGDLDRGSISGSGYVLHSLEASLWALLSSDSYEEAVLKAVNLGEDTDTTAAITGGIAGIYFGRNNQFDFWRAHLARFEDIEHLIERFAKAILT
ncbi:MAG: ADP-ribosylglycohydrolase family protein [Crocinitomix sp.]|nr:ADP-ribosylglycohydrolase family protein [Crocinitomix sp.]